MTATTAIDSPTAAEPTFPTSATPTNLVGGMTYRSVPTALLQPGPNARVVNETECADIAASIRQVGLLTPLLVAAMPGGRYRVIAGHRRLKALQMVGAETTSVAILAHVDELTEAQINAVENIVRTNLNPVEEAMAVARVVDGCGGDFARAATVFGRSVSYVRDHGYIAKFEGKARDLVASGRLPLAHARMIAKVTDPAARERLAKEAAADGEGGHPISLSQLDYRIGTLTKSLRLVPWDLEAQFGGFPACAGCPSNSDTDRYLFGAAESDGATCGNARCFERKTAAAAKAIEKTVMKLTVNGKEADLSAETVRSATPAGIKPTSVQRAAKKAVGVSEPKKPAAGVAKRDEGVDTWKLEREWRDTVLKPVEAALTDAIWARLIERPDRVLKALLLTVGRPFIPDGKEHLLLVEILDNRTANDVLESSLSGKDAEGFRERVFESLEDLLPYSGPTKKLLDLVGVEPYEGEKDFVARRTKEIKQAAATRAQAKPRAQTKQAAKAAKTSGKRGGKAAKR